MYFGNAVVLGQNNLMVKHERLAQIIADLDDSLRLAYIPEGQRSAFDKHQYAVIHTPENGAEPYVAMTIPDEDMDHRVVAKLIKRDTHKGAVLDEMEAQEAALRLVEANDALEELAEKRDLAEHVIKSNLHTYRHNGVVYN